MIPFPMTFLKRQIYRDGEQIIVFQKLELGKGLTTRDMGKFGVLEFSGVYMTVDICHTNWMYVNDASIF